MQPRWRRRRLDVTEVAMAEYWTETHARRVLEEWKRSGLSISAFARREGIRPRRLLWWRERLREKVPTAEAPPAARKRAAARDQKPATATFAPAVVKLAPRVTLPRATAAAVITTRSGRTIEIADAPRVPPAWVGAVVRELERSR
jgi:hypothetical protein